MIVLVYGCDVFMRGVKIKYIGPGLEVKYLFWGNEKRTLHAEESI
jgi:hypothetical protein